jgi:hypothetical protein
MKESDWKVFNQIKERATELFCTRALEEFAEVINNENEHVHNRYLLLYKLVQNRDKQMQLIFDGHSRSRAALQLLAIRGEGLAEEELLSKLSKDFLEATDPQRHNW